MSSLDERVAQRGGRAAAARVACGLIAALLFSGAALGASPWYDDEGPTRAAGLLLRALSSAADEGLNPDDFPTRSLSRDCLAGMPTDSTACARQLNELLLAYARTVGRGITRPEDMDANWHLNPDPPPDARLTHGLNSAGDVDRVLVEAPPPHPGYRRLRDALAKYRHIAADGGWPALPDGPTFRPGERHPDVALLRQRLAVTDRVSPPEGEPEHFDDGLKGAVERFQARHGLAVDGMVGKLTRAALNVPVDARIVQLLLNMERWRWMPRALGEEYLMVNLAGFQMQLMRNGQAVLSMRVINGRPDRTSPSFQSQLAHLVVNPDWTLPRRIAVEDMLPKLQRDPLALVDKQISVNRRVDGELVAVDPASVDWSVHHKDNFPYVLRQAPGPGNSLGRLKFVMPNPFAIFIHDTPARGLFNKPVRTLSSGCIRVEQPLRLASRLLEGDASRGEDWLAEQLQGSDTQLVPLPVRTPVYLVYFTAWVDNAGNLQLRDDVYGRNVQMVDRFSFR